MNKEGMANFICELRRAKNLTQKQLAEQLNITDKAVSKWERGLGYPDITTLSKLSEVLGVTINELLNGSRDETPVPKSDIIIQNTFQYAEKAITTKNKRTQIITNFIITLLFALATLICAICDLAVSKGLTWSLYPIISISFAWLVIMPLFHFEKNKIAMSLISLSIFIVPFLFCMEQLGMAKWLLPLGIPISIISIVYLWIIFWLFKKINSKWYASGITAVITIPLSLLINLISSRFTNDPFFDIWDAMSMGIIIVVAIILFAIGFLINKKTVGKI